MILKIVLKELHIMVQVYQKMIQDQEVLLSLYILKEIKLLKSLYTVFYYEGDADNYTDIPPSLCPNGSNPNIIRWDGSEQIVVKAPEITGYTINSENELTVSETNTVLAFYYTKNQ